jgi:hypothetical protein
MWLTEFKINIEATWSLSKYIFAPSEDNQRFDNFQANFEHNQKHDEEFANIWNNGQKNNNVASLNMKLQF